MAKLLLILLGGGNTQEVYQATEKDEYGQLKSDDNRKEFAESLQEQHPDVVVVTKKWGRFHHPCGLYKIFATTC